jgi:hypothetical protein
VAFCSRKCGGTHIHVIRQIVQDICLFPYLFGGNDSTRQVKTKLSLERKKYMCYGFYTLPQEISTRIRGMHISML